MVTDGTANQRLSIELYGGGPYGLRLSGGGRQPLTVAKMHRRSKAMAAGVEVGDELIGVDDVDCRHWDIDRTMNLINSADIRRPITLQLARATHEGNASYFGCYDNDDGHDLGLTWQPQQQPGDQFSQRSVNGHQFQQTASRPHFSSQLSTTSTLEVSPSVASGPNRTHISAVSIDRRPLASTQPTMAPSSDWKWNVETLKSDARPIYEQPSQSMFPVNPSRGVQPMMWRPPSALGVASTPARPVSAPPFRDMSSRMMSDADPVWNNEQGNGQDMLDTEVVIWSSKIGHDPAEPLYDADQDEWNDYSYEQPEVDIMSRSWPGPAPSFEQPHVDLPIATVPRHQFQENHFIPRDHLTSTNYYADFNGGGDQTGNGNGFGFNEQGRSFDDGRFQAGWETGNSFETRPQSTMPLSSQFQQVERSPDYFQHDRNHSALHLGNHSGRPPRPELIPPSRDQIPRWRSPPTVAHAQSSLQQREASPLFLRRVVVTGDDVDDVIDDAAYGLKKKEKSTDPTLR